MTFMGSGCLGSERTGWGAGGSSVNRRLLPVLGRTRFL